MAIQLFVPTFRVDECLKEIKECLDCGWTGLGFKTIEFEKKFLEYTYLSYAHFLNSATIGLDLAVEILKEENRWDDEDEIITTAFTFVSTNHAILYNNLKPIFADIDQYLCLDPNDVVKKITNRTKAIMFVGFGGSIGQYEKIEEICQEYGLKLIVDAAHMMGTKLNGETPAKNADCIVYSFQAVKNLPTADSGMICFKEKKYDEIVRKKSWLGINKDTYSRSTNDNGTYKWMYDVEYVGYKAHGNSVIAALGLVSLKYLDEDNAYRRQIAAWYDEGFKECKNIKTIPIPKSCVPSRHLYQILVGNRDQLILELNKHQIYPGVHYRDNSEYKMYSYAKGTCKNTIESSNNILSLPMHMRLTKADIEFIVEKVKLFVG